MKSEKECFWIESPPCDSQTDKRRPEISLQSTETDGKPDDQLICCGYVPVVLSKMYGPLIFADIRIRADLQTCEWVIERQNIKTMKWEEAIRIPGQIASEFDDDEKPDAPAEPSNAAGERQPAEPLKP